MGIAAGVAPMLDAGSVAKACVPCVASPKSRRIGVCGRFRACKAVAVLAIPQCGIARPSALELVGALCLIPPAGLPDLSMSSPARAGRGLLPREAPAIGRAMPPCAGHCPGGPHADTGNRGHDARGASARDGKGVWRHALALHCVRKRAVAERGVKDRQAGPKSGSRDRRNKAKRAAGSEAFLSRRPARARRGEGSRLRHGGRRGRRGAHGPGRPRVEVLLRGVPLGL